MAAAPKLKREKPVNVPLTCSAMCWRRVGKLIEFEMAQRGWNFAETCRRAIHPVSDKEMCHSTLTKLVDGDYKRGGPFLPTLHRVFCIAFKSSGYEISINSKGARLRR